MSSSRSCDPRPPRRTTATRRCSSCSPSCLACCDPRPPRRTTATRQDFNVLFFSAEPLRSSAAPEDDRHHHDDPGRACDLDQVAILGRPGGRPPPVRTSTCCSSARSRCDPRPPRRTTATAHDLAILQLDADWLRNKTSANIPSGDRWTSERLWESVFTCGSELHDQGVVVWEASGDSEGAYRGERASRHTVDANTVFGVVDDVLKAIDQGQQFLLRADDFEDGFLDPHSVPLTELGDLAQPPFALRRHRGDVVGDEK